MNSRAFTLVELVVTIGLILVLAGLTLSVSVAIVYGSEVRQTETTLRLLDQAVREWQVQADRQLTYGPTSYHDILAPTTHDVAEAAPRVTAKLLANISRSDAVKKILSQIDPDALRDEPDADDPTGPRLLLVLDAWGNKIGTVMPGMTWEEEESLGVPPSPHDDDGTIRTIIEIDCGVATNRQICFVSSGPDGAFGVADSTSPQFEQSKDNLFSVKPEQ